MDVNVKAVSYQNKRISFNSLIPMVILFFMFIILGGCAGVPKPVNQAGLDLDGAGEKPVEGSVVPELAPYGPDYETKSRSSVIRSDSTPDFYDHAYWYATAFINNTGVLTKAGQASIDSVNGQLLDSSADENGYGGGLGLGYTFSPLEWNNISPRISVSYEVSRGTKFEEDIQSFDGFRLMAGRELTGQGARFGGGFDMPVGKIWSIYANLGGTYMKNTVDLTVKGTLDGEGIGLIEKSASKTTLNPYGELGIMIWGPGRIQKQKEKMARWMAAAGVRVDRSTILDPNQGEFSDTMTSIFLDVKYKF